jgi:peptide/nickel transport system substrate-binding protein
VFGARRRLTLAATLAVLGLAVVAGTVAPSASGVASEQDQFAASSGGAVNVAFRADVRSLDPRKMIASAWRDVAIHIYEGLITKSWHTDPDGKALKIVPALASSWKISADRRTYTFQIRRGVTFHDGTPFNAAAVDFNFRTWWDRNHAQFDREAKANAGYNTNLIKSFAARGQYTFRITLNRPFASFLDRLSAASNLFIQSPTALKKYGSAGISEHPAGTGKFRVGRFVPGQGLILQRNERYWGTKAGAKTLVLRFMPDQAARVAALQSGEVQVAEGIPIQYEKTWAGHSKLGVIVRPRAASFICWTNFREGPTTKAAVRQALNFAIDRRAINRLIFGGRSLPSSGYFAPGNVAYDPKAAALTYNPARARQLLASAGHGSGLKLTFDVASNPNQADVLNIAKENLKAVGVDLQLNYYDVGTMISTKYVPGIKQGSGIDGQCVIAGGDEDYIFASYFTKAGHPPTGAFNPGHYTNPQVEAAMNKATAAKTQDEYVKWLREANKLMTADGGAWLFVLDMNVFGVAKNVDWKPQVRIRNDYTTVRIKG